MPWSVVSVRVVGRMQRLCVGRFLEYVHLAKRDVEVFVGIDPAVKTLGSFFLVDSVYTSVTEALTKKSIADKMGSSVECGIMIGEAFRAASRCRLLNVIDWLCTLQSVRSVNVAIEDSPFVSSTRGGGGASRPYTAAAGHWAAALASLLTRMNERIIVRSAHISSVKSNFLLVKTGDHSLNKNEALSLVREKMGLDVATNHEADAFLSLATVFFPRTITRRRKTSSSTGIPDTEELQQYINDFKSKFIPISTTSIFDEHGEYTRETHSTACPLCIQWRVNHY